MQTLLPAIETAGHPYNSAALPRSLWSEARVVFISYVYLLLLLYVCDCWYSAFQWPCRTRLLFDECMCLWSHNSRGRLADLVAEHLDHMHYLNDILSLDISALNDVLTDHLLNRLLVPLYVFSLVDASHSVAESVCSVLFVGQGIRF